MSLEQKIEALTSAVTSLTAAFNRREANVPPEVVSSKPAAKPAAPAAKAETPAAPAPQPAEDAAYKAAAAALNVVLKAQAPNGRAVAKLLLIPYGIETLLPLRDQKGAKDDVLAQITADFNDAAKVAAAVAKVPVGA